MLGEWVRERMDLQAIGRAGAAIVFAMTMGACSSIELQDTDPIRGWMSALSDFGRLGSEIWRAIRLVVDTGIHSKGWTEEQAVQYFLDNSAITEAQARSEVQRYIVMPGQATAYKIGMIKIQNLRKHAEEELGDKFDIRGFHDTVLGGGSMPLDLLERRVDQWIAEQKAA